VVDYWLGQIAGPRPCRAVHRGDRRPVPGTRRDRGSAQRSGRLTPPAVRRTPVDPISDGPHRPTGHSVPGGSASATTGAAAPTSRGVPD
jgi:hypothetical protein